MKQKKKYKLIRENLKIIDDKLRKYGSLHTV